MYALIKNQKFERWINLQVDYPNTSFPMPLSPSDLPENVVIVNINIPAPSTGMFEVVERNAAPSISNGNWELGWFVRNMTDEEKGVVLDTEKLKVKFKRNELLTNSDWTQILDNNLSEQQKEEWRKYRNELRDITLQKDYPLNIVWPAAPSP